MSKVVELVEDIEFGDFLGTRGERYSFIYDIEEDEGIGVLEVHEEDFKIYTITDIKYDEENGSPKYVTLKD